MKNRRTIWNLILAAVLAVYAMPALADDSDLPPLPQQVQAGNVAYISGGIGDEEREAIKASAENYNLFITVANSKGQYTSDSSFTIIGRDGHMLLTVANAGPLFYVKLPPGEYKVAATNGDQHDTKTVKISAKGKNRLHFVWPQN